MRWVRQATSRHWFDLLIALVAVAAMLEIVFGQDRPGSGAPNTTLWFCLPAVAVLGSLIFFRGRFPFAVPTLYWLVAVAISFVDWRLTTFPISLFLLGMANAFLLGNLRNRLEAGMGLAIVAASPSVIVYLIPGHSAAQMIFIPLQFAISWLAGLAVRDRAEQAEAAETRAEVAERERDVVARVAVAEERARIARELHDIVAHAVSVMVLQVGAVRHRLEGQEDGDALKAVEQAGRTALTEMRRLLAAMRHDDETAELGPQPGLDELASLLAEVGRAGLPVELHVDGEPVALPRGIDLSAYRIVQEGLTNALKHARASTADVTLSYQPHALQLEIRDDGIGSHTSDGLGHGLIGIRERVKIYGGEMSTRAGNRGGFVLSTRFPLDGDRP